MKKLWKIVPLAVVLALGVWIYQILFPSDEKLIRQLLATVAETAAVKPNENPLLKLAGANKLVGFFSPNAVLKIDVAGVDIHTIDNREDLLQALTAARASLQQASFQLHEVHVTVNPDQQSAVAQFVASAYLNSSTDPLVQELKTELKKIDGRWKITQVDTVKTLGM